MKTLIIARNYAQANQHAREKGLALHSWTPITSKHDLEKIRGLENPEVIYLACPSDVDAAELDSLLRSRAR